VLVAVQSGSLAINRMSIDLIRERCRARPAHRYSDHPIDMLELFISALGKLRNQLREAQSNSISSRARSRKPSKREDTRLDPKLGYDHPSRPGRVLEPREKAPKLKIGLRESQNYLDQ
jgi:hypothetical protein